MEVSAFMESATYCKNIMSFSTIWKSQARTNMYPLMTSTHILTRLLYVVTRQGVSVLKSAPTLLLLGCHAPISLYAKNRPNSSPFEHNRVTPDWRHCLFGLVKLRWQARQ